MGWSPARGNLSGQRLRQQINKHVTKVMASCLTSASVSALFECWNTCGARSECSLGTASFAVLLSEEAGAWGRGCMWDLKKCILLRAAGGLCVCSAGRTGCFYKGGDPRLHNPLMARCLQGLTMQGHVVSGVCVTTICSVCREWAGTKPFL